MELFTLYFDLLLFYIELSFCGFGLSDQSHGRNKEDDEGA